MCRMHTKWTISPGGHSPASDYTHGALAALKRVAISLKATGIATGIIPFFALLGTPILSALGVTFPALQAAGGIILLTIALDMIFELGSAEAP